MLLATERTATDTASSGASIPDRRRRRESSPGRYQTRVPSKSSAATTAPMYTDRSGSSLLNPEEADDTAVWSPAARTPSWLAFRLVKSGSRFEIRGLAISRPVQSAS